MVVVVAVPLRLPGVVQLALVGAGGRGLGVAAATAAAVGLTLKLDNYLGERMKSEQNKVKSKAENGIMEPINLKSRLIQEICAGSPSKKGHAKTWNSRTKQIMQQIQDLETVICAI